MKIDLYTKVVLTVIAAAMTFNVAKDLNFVTPAQAAPVAIPSPHEAKSEGVLDVNIVQVNGRTFSGDKLPTEKQSFPSTMDVKVINYSSIPVDITNSYINTKPY